MGIQHRLGGAALRCAALLLATALPATVSAQEFQDLVEKYVARSFTRRVTDEVTETDLAVDA